MRNSSSVSKVDGGAPSSRSSTHRVGSDASMVHRLVEGLLEDHEPGDGPGERRGSSSSASSARDPELLDQREPVARDRARRRRRELARQLEHAWVRAPVVAHRVEVVLEPASGSAAGRAA